MMGFARQTAPVPRRVAGLPAPARQATRPRPFRRLHQRHPGLCTRFLARGAPGWRSALVLEAARIFRDEAGKATRVVGVNVDIHDQKQLEAQVAAQLDFQQALIDAIPVPLFYKGRMGATPGSTARTSRPLG